MPNPTKIIVDCSTGITTEVELTAEEIAQREADAAKAQADKVAKDAELAEQAKVKAAVLKKLGLSEKEAKALLS